jgi:ubiquinone/menaquinone biosynthesis C-methylase UbiE
MLRLAKTRKISAIRGRAEQLPFKDGAFDYALMIEALSFVTEPAAAIQEAHRVLRDGGSMVVYPAGTAIRRRTPSTHPTSPPSRWLQEYSL